MNHQQAYRPQNPSPLYRRPLLTVVLLAIAGIAYALGVHRDHARAAAQASAAACVAGPGEVCPSENFLWRWDRFADLRSKVNLEEKSRSVNHGQLEDDEDLLNGRFDRLANIGRSECGPQCVFDERARKYVFRMPAAPPAPAPPPVAATPPAQGKK